MPARPRSHNINPLLGIYFGIFVACLGAIVVLLLIFEQLGVSEDRLRLLMTLGSIGLYAAIGAAAYTAAPSEFFFAGRRVPSFFVGAALAVTAIGGTGLVAIGGAMFLAGFDALCVPIGIVAGFVAMVILIAPYLRKFGAPTVPGYLGMRFDSPLVRLAGASAAAAPLILLLVAELKVAAMAASWLIDLSEPLLIAMLVATLVVTLLPGGIRSLAWSGAAQSITALLALLVPAAIIAVMATNLPLGQLSHGPVLRALGRTEVAKGIPVAIAGLFTFELPGQAMQTISGRYLSAFASVGPAAFVLAALGCMMGTAASPIHLGRSTTAPSVYEARKSIGWSVLLAGIVVMTLSSLAVFQRDVLLGQIAGTSPAAMAPGLRTLIELGLAEVEPGVPELSATNVAFRRDGTLLALPILMGFPASLVLLVAAGALAAALAAAASSLAQLGVIVAVDVMAGTPGEPRPAPAAGRLLLTRIVLATVAVGAGGCAMIARRDPLELMLWSLALSGAALFPVLVLSIWWKRINVWGAFAGLAAGLLVTAMVLILSVTGAIAWPAALAGVPGFAASLTAAIIVSQLTPAPGRHLLEMVRDLRIPGGESVYDRELRLTRQRRDMTLR